MGLLATGAMIILACVSYPLAYRSRMRNVVEGSGARSTQSWFAGADLDAPASHAAPSTSATGNLSLHRPDALANAASPRLSRHVRRSWTGASHFVRSYVQARSRHGQARSLDRRVTCGSAHYRLLDGRRVARCLPRPSRPQGQLDIPHHSRQAGMGRVCGNENVGTRMGACPHAREHRVDSSRRAA